MATTIERLRVEVGGDTSGAVDALEELEAAGEDVPNWVGAATAALGGLFAVGVGAGAALTAGLLGNIDATDANNKLAAQLALTGPESERYGDIAGALYAGAYGESLSEVNDALGAVASSVEGMADASSDVLSGATASVMDFATAFDTDVTRAAQVAGQTISRGLAPDFDSAMDLMVTASQKVPAAIREDLLDVADEYGGVFSQLGFSGEEMFSALVNASEKGAIGLDKAGDSLKEFTILSTDGSAAEVYEKIGLNAEEMSNRILGGGADAQVAFQQIVAGLQGIEDPSEKANAAIAFFGAPLEDLGTGDIPQFLDGLTGLTDGLGDTEGAAQRMGETLNKGPGVALETLKRTVADAFMGFTDTAIPVITEFATAVTAQVQPAAEALVSFVTGDLIPALQSGADFVERNADAFKIAAGVILAVFLPALVKMVVQSGIATVKVVAGWVAQQAAAVAAGAAVWVQMVRMVAGWVMMAARAAVSAAQTVALWAMYQAAAIRAAASSAVTVARVVAGWVLMGAQSMIQGARMAAAWVLAMGPVGWIIATVVALVALIIANWDTVSSTTAAVWDTIVGWVTGAWDTIVGWVGTAVEAVRAVIATVFDAIATFVQAHVDAVQLIITTVWDVIGGVVTTAVELIKTVVSTAFSVLVTIITTYVGFWLAVITGVWTAIQTVVQVGVDLVKSVIETVFNVVTTVISTIVEGWRSAVSGAMDAIKSLVSGAVEGVKGFIGGLSSIGETVTGYFESARSGAKQKLDELVEFVKGVPESIKNGLSSIGTKLYSSGRALLQGFLDGIMSMVDTIKKKVEGFVGGIRDYFPFSPAKVGPFSGKGYVSYSGEAIGQDFADSIAAQAGDAERAAARLMAAAALDVPSLTAQREQGGLGAVSYPSREAMGLADDQLGGERILNVTIVDADGKLIGKMRTEAGKVMTGRTTPLDEGIPTW